MRKAMERSAFGVCSYLAARMGVASARVRVYFIYIACLTFGSPVLLYLFAAFWLNLRQYMRRAKHIVWQ